MAAVQLQIGDIQLLPGVARTPIGDIPLQGSAWRLDETGAYATRTSTAVTVLAILLIPCTGFLSLLLLLIKERYVNGWVTVEVGSPIGVYQSRIYVNGFPALQAIRYSVDQARAAALALSWPRRQIGA